MGYARLAQKDWEAQTPEAARILESYAAGINAALQTQPEAYEFQTLGGHKPEPWTPLDSLTVLKMVSDTAQWQLKRNHGLMLQALGPEALNLILPDLPAGSSVHVPAGGAWSAERSAYHVDEDGLGTPGYQDSGKSGGGSNCWAGSETANPA